MLSSVLKQSTKQPPNHHHPRRTLVIGAPVAAMASCCSGKLTAEQQRKRSAGESTQPEFTRHDNLSLSPCLPPSYMCQQVQGTAFSAA